MPTYKNNRSSALILSTFAGLAARSVEPGANFVAHPDEVPGGWLKPVDKDGNPLPPIVTKESDLPEVPAPKRPEPPQTPASVDMLREELRRENIKLEMELEKMRRENEERRAQNLAAETAKASAPPTAGEPAQPAAPSAARGKPADKDEKKS